MQGAMVIQLKSFAVQVLFLVRWDWVHLVVLRPLLAYGTTPRW
jgi:hypothetical protein